MELKKVGKHPSVTDHAQHHGHLLNDNKGFGVFLNVWEALDPGTVVSCLYLPSNWTSKIL
jgi:hypothetical protein